MEYTLLASACAAAAVLLASLVIGEFLGIFTAKYKEKYMKEAAVEADNILLALPPSRILDLSLILSVCSAFIAAGTVGFSSQELSVTKMVLSGRNGNRLPKPDTREIASAHGSFRHK